MPGASQVSSVGAAAGGGLGPGEGEARHAEQPVGVDHLVQLVRARGREAVEVAACAVLAAGGEQA